MNEEKMFLRYRGMVSKKAWSVARAFGLDYDELCSEGYELFVTALRQYDERMGQFSTYLHHKLRGLSDVYFRRNRDSVRMMDLDVESYCAPARSLFDAFVEELELHDSAEQALSEQARQVLSYILARPERRHTVNSVYLHLRSLGWSVKQAEMSLLEIKSWWRGYCAA